MANQGANKGTYLSADELAAVEAAAERAGLTVSGWIKTAIKEAIKKAHIKTAINQALKKAP